MKTKIKKKTKIKYEFLGKNCVVLSSQGNRMDMNDEYIIDTFKDIKIFGLFDGHNGSYISKSLPNLTKILNKYIDMYFNNIINYINLVEIINNEFIKIDKQYYIKNIKQGSTLLILYIYNNNLLIVNLGDSKTIIIDKNYNHIFETLQHRPDDINEQKRINKTKYTIINNNGILRINNEISLSRCFGDFKYKISEYDEQSLSCFASVFQINEIYDGIYSAISVIPKLYRYNIDNNSYIIIASDGFWDFIKYKDIKYIFIKYKLLDLEFIAKKLIKKTINSGSNDNITIILIKI